MTKQSWFGWGFFASLAFNVFLAGAFIGQYLSKDPPPISAPTAQPGYPNRPGHVPEHQRHTGGFKRLDGSRKPGGAPSAQGRLPGRRGDASSRHRMKDDGSAHSVLREMGRAMGGRNDPRVQEVLKAQHGSFRAEREAIHAAHNDVRRALVAEPFDADALQKALAELLQRTKQVQLQAQHSVVRLANQMTPEERARLRQHLTE